MLNHESFMREAIELSRHGFPFYAHVGCVLVRDGEIVGRGFHDYTGGPHAEVVAIQDAGDKAKGSTAYVTMEPCNHHGKTPPCTDALLGAGIKNVYIAATDPNPKATGGTEKLQAAGVEVHFGVCTAEAVSANLQFHFAFQAGRPMVTVKAGMTLDGKIALPSGESKWITNEASRKDAMRLRANIGCVMVGRTTAQLDRARLNVRGIEVVQQPLRVVVDPQAKLSSDLPIFDVSAPTLHLTGQNLDPASILQRIRESERTGVLIEGGPTTVAHFMRANLVDRLVLYIAPKVFGDGKSWMGPFGLTDLGSSPEFELVETSVIEGDIKLILHSRNIQNFLASYNL